MLKRTENRNSNKYLYTHIYNSIIPNSQKVRATQGSINRLMDQEKSVIYIKWKNYSALKINSETRKNQ